MFIYTGALVSVQFQAPTDQDTVLITAKCEPAQRSSCLCVDCVYISLCTHVLTFICVHGSCPFMGRYALCCITYVGMDSQVNI